MVTDLTLRADGGSGADVSRFALHRVNAIEWDIVDTTVPEASATHVIAYIFKYDRLEYGVTWVGDFDLRAEYASPDEALDDVCHAGVAPPRARSERPVPIPHLPPPTSQE